MDLGHGCVEVDPRIPACHLMGMPGQKRRKSRIEKIRVARAAPMMAERRNHPYAEFPQSLEALVMPTPIELIRRIR